jgi:hypothetical protein
MVDGRVTHGGDPPEMVAFGVSEARRRPIADELAEELGRLFTRRVERVAGRSPMNLRRNSAASLPAG